MRIREDIHPIAEAYLKEIGASEIPCVTVRGTLHGEVYGDETLEMFTARVEEERRYEIEDEPSEVFVLKDRIRYFYGFKDRQPKWTYDERLAFKFTNVDVDIAVEDLGSLGVQVTKQTVIQAVSSL